MMRKGKKNDDFIPLLRNALFTVWVSPCMTVSQTVMIPVTFERHLAFFVVVASYLSEWECDLQPSQMSKSSLPLSRAYSSSVLPSLPR